MPQQIDAASTDTPAAEQAPETAEVEGESIDAEKPEPVPAPTPAEEIIISESDKAQAQIREVAAAAGVANENIEFDELLEMLLNDNADKQGKKDSENK